MDGQPETLSLQCPNQVQSVLQTNNLAERMIRPAVILRKNCQSNRSEKGAAVQAVLMSLYRTLKLRRHDPLATIDSALRAYLKTGQLPPLPIQSVADE